MGFFIAMQNRRATASYWHPQTVISERNEFLIASRWGASDEYLSISSAGAGTGLEEEAPSELTPDLVILATLVSQGPDGAEIFLVEPELPPGIETEGRFMGGDGYIRLIRSDRDVELAGTVRVRPGAATRLTSRGCPLLAENEPGAAVHLKAAYLPWVRELLPSDFECGGLVRKSCAP